MVILFYGYLQKWWLSLDACPLFAHSSYDGSSPTAGDDGESADSESSESSSSSSAADEPMKDMNAVPSGKMNLVHAEQQLKKDMSHNTLFFVYNRPCNSSEE